MLSVGVIEAPEFWRKEFGQSGACRTGNFAGA